MALMANPAEKLASNTVFNPGELRKQTQELRAVQEQRRLDLEKHQASVWTGVSGAWRFETGTGVAATQIKDAMDDQTQLRFGDPDFNLQESLQVDSVEFPKENTAEQEVLGEARNLYHYELLKGRLRDKREFRFNAEDMGLPATMALQVVAEFANVPNYLTFGLSNLAKAKKLKRFVVAGLVTGTANVAEEAYINSVLKDRTATDYVVAGAMGMGLGWLGTLGGKDPGVAAHIDEVGSAFRARHIDEAAQEIKEGMPGTAPRKAPDGSEQVPFGENTAGSASMPGIKETLDPVHGPGLKTPMADPDSPVMQAAYRKMLDGDLPQAEKLWHEKYGLASMGQSTHSSENPVTRFMGGELLEFAEGSGFKGSTAALESSKDFMYFSNGYMKGYVDFKTEFNTLAESLGLTQSFDEAASLWVSGSKSIESTDLNLAKLMDAYEQHYIKWNDWTYKRMKDSGVDIAEDLDYDSKHLFHSWDGKAVHAMRNKYDSETVIETFMGAIENGKRFGEAQKEATKAFETDVLKVHADEIAVLQKELDDLKAKAAGMDNTVSPKGLRAARDVETKLRELDAKKANTPVYKAPDTKVEVRSIAQAFHNRFIRRATVNTADANLFSAANRGLLKDAISDVPMDTAHRQHINAVIESMGKDQKANPLKHKTSMDLGYTHPKGLRLQDMMHTDLGSAYASKQRYWLGRSAGARHGFPSEEAFMEGIDQVKNHGSDRKMSAEDITADVARLEAGWKLIKGEPVEQMDRAGDVAMRVIRKLVQTSMLGKLGITQAGETGRVMAASGVTNIMEGIPFIKNMITDLKNGNLDTPMLEEFERLLIGKIGNEHYMDHPDFRVDDFGHAISKAEKNLDKANYWLSAASGWRIVYQQQKRILMDHLGHRFYDWFANGKMTKAQMDDLGVPYHQIDAIKASMLEHAKFKEDGTLESLGLDSWDPDLRETIALMLHRKSANAIQEILAGETPLWMNQGLGKFLGQFKTFSVAALAKQTVHDWRMHKEGDKEAALAFQFMLASATAAQIARVGFNAAMQPAETRADYLNSKLHPGAIAKDILMYHGQTGPLLDVTDLLASTVMPDSWGKLTGSQFRQRDLLNRIPGISYMNRAAKGVGGVGAALNPYDEMSKSEWNAIVGTMPLSSWYGFHALNKKVLTPMLFNNKE